MGPQPEPSDRDLLDAQAWRRRQLDHALLEGRLSEGEAWDGAVVRGLLIGVAVAILIALVVGIAALVQTSVKGHQQQRAGAGAPVAAIATAATGPG